MSPSTAEQQEQFVNLIASDKKGVVMSLPYPMQIRLEPSTGYIYEFYGLGAVIARLGFSGEMDIEHSLRCTQAFKGKMYQVGQNFEEAMKAVDVVIGGLVKPEVN